MTVTETRAAYEAATLEAMHTGDYTAPDLEYTPIPDPLPQIVPASEAAALCADLELCVGYLRQIATGSFTVKLLAQLADVCEEMEARWGLNQ